MKNVLFLHLFFASIEGSILTLRLPTVSFGMISGSSSVLADQSELNIPKKRPQDITTSRAHTLFDDADDIQRQLDNEARDRLKNSKATCVWVFQYPSGRKWGGAVGYRIRPRIKRKKQIFDNNEYRDAMKYLSQCPEWSYPNQSAWGQLYPTCCGRSQSPVDLPHSLLKVTGAKELIFRNHDVQPLSLSMINDGRSVKLTGKWHPNTRPFVQGGAVHGRRYIFESIHLHWPSEHTIGTMHYPLESQAFYVSVEYPNLAAALRATDDNMALLAISTIYSIGNESNPGINAMMNAALSPVIGGRPMATDNTLGFFVPPFKEYASYQGSLTRPPCTESVIWLIRARSLPVTATIFKAAQRMKVDGEQQRFIFRDVQPLNDRNVYYFG